MSNVPELFVIYGCFSQLAICIAFVLSDIKVMFVLIWSSGANIWSSSHALTVSIINGMLYKSCEKYHLFCSKVGGEIYLFTYVFLLGPLPSLGIIIALWFIKCLVGCVLKYESNVTSNGPVLLIVTI